jgi:UDP-N-acetylglucosamine--N-acetylmuramyl-(pentapeptide) pyrophosphoryl-undecaprenol N-acetylglucosamine transferase
VISMVAESSGVIAIFAGGTGGHIYPALAVAQELSQRGYDIHWFGTDRGLESRVVPAAGYPLYILGAQGLRGKSWRESASGFLAMARSLLQAYWQLRGLHVVCALGMGGYVSGPAGMAAWLAGVPLVIHEQNSVAGTTNRLLRHFASRVLCAYPNAFSYGRAVREVGNPVRADLLQQGVLASYDYHAGRPLHLLVVGGSLGARAINEVIPQALARLSPGCQIQVRHQTGTAHSEKVNLAYRMLPEVSVEVLPFINDMAAAYCWADLVLCRAGALTLAELTVMSRPSILVPLPQSIDNHQLHNAEWLCQRDGALLLSQSELDPKTVADHLQLLARNPARLAAMAHAARSAGRTEATHDVADICEEVRRGG